MSNPSPNVGGQAVIEGVMMRSPHCLAVAIRRKNNAIVVQERPWKSTVAEKLLKIPFVRGALVLYESMQNGYAALQFSAEQYEQDLPDDVRPAEGEGASSGAASRLGLVLSIGLMVALPKLLAWGAGHLFGGGLSIADPRFHILAGFFKLCIVIGMMLSMRMNAEMFRVFQYHGAEHKAIATHESGEELTVENARRHSTRHARCGTTFLMVVVIVSVVIFALVLPLLLPHSSGLGTALASIAISIPLMIPIAGVAYEFQRLGARFVNNPIAQIFLGPGYLVQRITTAEPSDDQLEIALSALKVTLAREAEKTAGPVETPQVQAFSSFAALSTQYGL